MDQVSYACLKNGDSVYNLQQCYSRCHRFLHSIMFRLKSNNIVMRDRLPWEANLKY